MENSNMPNNNNYNNYNNANYNNYNNANYNNVYPNNSNTNNKKKKGNGCLIASIIIIVSFVVIAGGIYWGAKKISKAMSDKVSNAIEGSSALNDVKGAIGAFGDLSEGAENLDLNEIMKILNGLGLDLGDLPEGLEGLDLGNLNGLNLEELLGELSGSDINGANQDSTPFIQNSQSKIEEAYKKGELTTDQYVQQMLYVAYDESMISNEYKSEGRSYNATNICKMVEKYYDELSDQTKEYYAGKVLLKDVTFYNELENTSVRNNPFSITAFAAEESVTNLGRVYVTPNQRFVVWYTTKGKSAVTEDDAKMIGNIIQQSTDTYCSLFDVEYIYKSRHLLDNDVDSQQKKLLTDNGYDSSLVKEAMSVYLLENNGGQLAAYTNNTKVEILEYWVNGFEHSNGVNYLPYIVIKPSSLSSGDDLEQLTNHELFHHFQAQPLAEKYKGKSPYVKFDDGYILDGAANLASALISKSSGDDTFLRDWASRYPRNCDAFTTTYANNGDYQFGGSEDIAYATFILLQAYNESVDRGLDKIAEAYYKDEEFHFLENEMTKDENRKFAQYLSYHTMAQDYSNKCFCSSTGLFVLKNTEVKAGDEKKGNALSRMATNYYKISGSEPVESIIITDKNHKFTDEITDKSVLSNTYFSTFVYAFLYGLKNGKYDVIECVDISGADKIDFPQNSGYEEFYLAVCNGNMREDADEYEYSVQFKKDDTIQSEEQENTDVEYEPNEIVFDTDIKNYNVTITMSLGIGEDLGMGATVSEGVVDQLHQKEHLYSNTKVMGMDVKSEIYVDYAKGVSYTKIPFMGTWEQSQEAAQTVDIGSVMDQFKERGKVEKISANCYKVKIPSNAVSGSAKSSGQDIDMSKVGDEITATVYVSGRYIAKMEYNFGDFMSATIEFSNYNNAGDVNMPANLK